MANQELTRRLYVGEIQQAANREVMTASYMNRHLLVAEARRLQRRGEIALIPGARPKWSDEGQEWRFPVYRVRQQKEARIPKKIWSIFVVLAGLALVIGAAAWFLTALSATALVVLCLAALAGLYLMVGAGRSRVDVTTITHTRVR